MASFRVLDAALPTYSVNLILQTAPAAATDLLVFACPSGCKAKFRWIEIGGTAAALRQVPVSLIRRITPNTGGTSAPVVIGKADPTDGNSQVTCLLYTANAASLGTAAYTVDSGSFTIQTGTAASIQDRLIFNYESFTDKPPTFGMTLTDYLCFNFAAVATVASTDHFDLEAWWTEG